jgi:hypothetical protein
VPPLPPACAIWTFAAGWPAPSPEDTPPMAAWAWKAAVMMPPEAASPIRRLRMSYPFTQVRWGMPSALATFPNVAAVVDEELPENGCRLGRDTGRPDRSVIFHKPRGKITRHQFAARRLLLVNDPDCRPAGCPGRMRNTGREMETENV